jgi:hypothetical protein
MRCSNSHFVTGDAFREKMYEAVVAMKVISKADIEAAMEAWCSFLSQSPRAWYKVFAGKTIPQCIAAGEEHKIKFPEDFKFTESLAKSTYFSIPVPMGYVQSDDCPLDPAKKQMVTSMRERLNRVRVEQVMKEAAVFDSYF